jgi:predicted xylose isomerase-like sugar epimerase
VMSRSGPKEKSSIKNFSFLLPEMEVMIAASMMTSLVDPEGFSICSIDLKSNDRRLKDRRFL